MKKIYTIIVLVLIIISCSKPSECIESTGDIITKTVEVAAFTKIKFYKGISVVLTQGTIHNVSIKTGENLMSDIEVFVTDNMLIIKDNTTCNWVRDYGQTIVYITAPNITDIISKSEKPISSNGILTYSNLRLESLDVTDGPGTGDFDLQINNISNFHISGQTINMTANLYEGNGRIEAPNFVAQNISVYHRGTNDIIVNPQVKIEGNLYSTGNLICKNHPPIVNVTAHYQGSLIFR